MAKVSPTQIIVNTVNPGLVQSSIHRENQNAAEKKFTTIFGRTTEEGGRALVDAAVVQGAATHGGKIFSDFEMDKIAWQKKSRPPSGFATINPKNPKKNHVFLI